MDIIITILKLLLQAPYSIPSVGDYCGKYPLQYNFLGELLNGGGFPLSSPEGITF